MSSPDHVCPPLDALDPSALRADAAAFEAAAVDNAITMPADRRAALWRIAAAMRLAAIVVESGEAAVGGHLAALKAEIAEGE